MGPAWSTGYSVMLIVSLDRISVRAAYSPAAPVPQNLTSGRHSERLTPKSLILEVIGLGRMGPIFMAASCSQDVRRPIHQDPTRGSPSVTGPGWSIPLSLDPVAGVFLLSGVGALPPP